MRILAALRLRLGFDGRAALRASSV
jgi:hypothetical protein